MREPLFRIRWAGVEKEGCRGERMIWDVVPRASLISLVMLALFSCRTAAYSLIKARGYHQ